MAGQVDKNKILNALSSLNLGQTTDDTERPGTFLDSAVVEMKFTGEELWLDAVWNCKRKPNYGMRELDGILEERAGNKFELTGPLIDGYLRELGKSISNKLGRSRNTGLMPPVRLFVPYTIFRHLCNIMVGYGGTMASNKKCITITIEAFETASKVFSPARLGGLNVLKKRHFNKIKENDRQVLLYNGRAAVVVGKATPIVFEYNLKSERVTMTFYVQRYSKEDFCLDLRLQTLLNNVSPDV